VREREFACVCACVCVRTRKRERGCVCVGHYLVRKGVNSTETIEDDRTVL